ncbi:MAG: WbqC family protein [Gammaproteobacteria bacterium]|nr:WbqC family protein [Gammaproteobacteria bacterium]
MTAQRTAIMQPYIFPYIGYFHLIQSSSMFVFYDDVHYIMRGWINRNRILNQEHDLLFTVPLAKASRNKLINEISPAFDNRWKDSFYRSLAHNYKKAPFFNEAIDSVMSPFSREYDDITDLAIESILSVYSYLGMHFNYTKSSIFSPETKDMDSADRLIEITKKFGFVDYVNAPGGSSLYSKEYFQSQGVNLFFVKSHPIQYKQYHGNFVPGLSAIDLLMFCSKSKIIDFFSSYSLE